MTSLNTLLQHYHPNVLIIGSDQATEATLKGIQPLLDMPVETRELPGPLSLPKSDCGALILRNVGAMAAQQQAELMEWMEHIPRVPVVSVHPSPLFDLVAKGMFSERLYYRLNTVLEDTELLYSTVN